MCDNLQHTVGGVITINLSVVLTPKMWLRHEENSTEPIILPFVEKQRKKEEEAVGQVIKVKLNATIHTHQTLFFFLEEQVSVHAINKSVNDVAVESDKFKSREREEM